MRHYLSDQQNPPPDLSLCIHCHGILDSVQRVTHLWDKESNDIKQQISCSAQISYLVITRNVRTLGYTRAL